jgi:hypothetical protein
VANHGFVNLPLTITVEELHAALDEINKKRFKGLLCVEYDEPSKTFEVIAGKGKKSEEHRLIFLRDDHDFSKDLKWDPQGAASRVEIRHGGGSRFIWWIDCVITNELAIKFKGYITDEGTGDEVIKSRSKLWPTFRSYLEEFHDLPRPKNSNIGYGVYKFVGKLFMHEEVRLTKKMYPEFKSLI